jgi:7-cyano-7-deazaguanine synthase
MTHKAVCLISGGIDSCVTAFIAKKEGYETYALSFNYGQIHSNELDSAKKIAKAVNSKAHIIFDLDLKKFGGSSLLDKSFPLPKNQDLKKIGEKIPSTYVPARNTIFLSIALAYAEVINAETIYIGANALDYSGYPDCRPKYLQAFQEMANLANKRGIEGKPVQIKAPLLNLTKAEIIKKGLDLHAPLDLTWSCYQGGEKACGKCDSCLLRLKGFKEVSIKDPLMYEVLPAWYKK